MGLMTVMWVWTGVLPYGQAGCPHFRTRMDLTVLLIADTSNDFFYTRLQILA